MKDEFCEIMQRLKESSVHGNFTRRENLHLTLVFLGEIPPVKINTIKNAMSHVRKQTLELSFSGFGNFSDILWIGIDKSDSLVQLQKELSDELANLGFKIEKREFKPHLTLCREAALPAGFDRQAFRDSIRPMAMIVDQIDLMKSERSNGRMVYTVVHTISR